MRVSTQARYGGSTGSGRRITDLEEPETIGKARGFDPEHGRQRRYGMAEAALLGGGGILAFRGGRKLVKVTRNVHAQTGAWKDGPLRQAIRQSAIVPPKPAAQLGGGVAAIGAAGALNAHANTRRGRAWN